MSTVEEKLAKSLTSESTEIIPFLPYLLQDLWELGSSPKDIIAMLAGHIKMSEKIKVLDLACGKGAVSVQLAKAFGCMVKGVDIIPEFIDYAKQKAGEYKVENLCVFETGDINESVKVEKDYDIAILGAVGDVLGNPEETLCKLKGTIKKGGHIIIDDAYASSDTGNGYMTKDQWLSAFRRTGLMPVDEAFNNEEELKSLNDCQQGFIRKRAAELIEKHPDKAHLFKSYVECQQAECDELENDIEGVTMLLRML